MIQNDTKALAHDKSQNQTREPVCLNSQSARLLALYDAAMDKGNLTAAASCLKQLSDLHGLGKAAPHDDSDIEVMSDAALEQHIRDLLRQTGFAPALPETVEPETVQPEHTEAEPAKSEPACRER